VIIGVTGDTHNNLKNIKTICSIFNENKADLVLHTGDISLPKSLLAFKELICPLFAVFGNNDIGEIDSLKEAATKFNCKIYHEPFFIELEGKKISLLHHPDLIDDEMILNNDLILHGHTHRFRLERLDDCIIFNPGECAGFMKNKNQVGIIDLKIKEPKIINF
jgi:putative phosphoesterase